MSKAFQLTEQSHTASAQGSAATIIRQKSPRSCMALTKTIFQAHDCVVRPHV